MRARRDRLTIGLAALGCLFCIASPVSATAGTAIFTDLSAGTLTVSGGGNPGVTSPLAPPSSPGVVMITGTPIMASSNSTSATSNDEQRGPDAKWGDPLSTKLLDSDDLQAGFHYYAGSSQGGDQGGVSFTLTFKN